MDQDLQFRQRGRPKSNLTPEERKQKHAEYIKQYYLQNKEKMNRNARRSYLRKNNLPAIQVGNCYSSLILI
jgi:hypothetical protein